MCYRQSTYYLLHEQILLLSYFNSITRKLKFGLLYRYNEAQSLDSSFLRVILQE